MKNGIPNIISIQIGIKSLHQKLRVFTRKMDVHWLKSSKLAPPSLKQRRFFNANFTDFSAHRARSIFKPYFAYNLHNTPLLPQKAWQKKNQLF